MIRPTFYMADEDGFELDTERDDALGPKEILKEQLKTYDDEAISGLAVDLYELLSKDRIDESQDLIDQFFEQHYRTAIDEDEFKLEEFDETPLEKPKKVEDNSKEVQE